ncbi:MAG: class I SAM-dependent methyltransferase [Bacteroidales bacterium]|jgi:hypothetical protein|nr:class I SAM-dependent methyltransferase [Bacteroidales bacterium]
MDIKEITTNTNRHPWELSRADAMLKILKKYNKKSYADIGAGDRYFCEQLLNIGATIVYAVDSEYPEERAEKNNVICLNDIALLEDKSVECLVMMDVLEHIEDDKSFLNQALKKLTDDGMLLITVPAWQFLFSSHDTFLHHYRRYCKRRLTTLLKTADITIAKSHYFYTSLFFARLLSNLIKPNKQEKVGESELGSWSFPPQHIATKLVKFVLKVDYATNSFLDKLHIHLPGLSLLAVCFKKPS